MQVHQSITLAGSGCPGECDRKCERGLAELDGDAVKALLQHPLGLDVRDGTLYIADAYSKEEKRMGIKAECIETITGDGKLGHLDGATISPQFYKPGGASLFDGSLF